MLVLVRLVCLLSSCSAAAQSSSCFDCRTEVSGTAESAANSMSPYPTRAMSSGTEIACLGQAAQQPEGEQVGGAEGGGRGLRRAQQFVAHRTGRLPPVTPATAMAAADLGASGGRVMVGSSAPPALAVLAAWRCTRRTGSVTSLCSCSAPCTPMS